jgi:heterotetrameric sarcosine oxidase gamma subunit
MADTALSGQSALSLPHQPEQGGGVTFCERLGLGIATIQSRKRQDSALRDRIRQHFLLELPSRPAIASAGEVSFVGTGPGRWLALSENAGPLFGGALRQIVAPLASVADQSGGHAVFRVGGKSIKEALAKGFAVDLHPSAFGTADAATTVVAHIGATIWRCDDDAEGHARFEIAVARSLAQSFWNWFSNSAAEFGCERQRAAGR